MRDLDTAYARRQGTNAPWIGQGVPKAGHRTSRYLQFACGAGGNSYRRWQWNKSTAWEYWIPGCLSESSTRFRKYFRISRERFDMIYEAAARSGQFGLNPEDPLYSTVYPGPTRPGRHQDFKRIPLCLFMAASFRRVASGYVFSTLGEEFHISSSALSTFDKKFWKWFRKEYWETWVGGVSGVGFDDIATIEQEEKLFRQMGLPGFITCMDGVHFAWERAPYQLRWQYIGKEGYPTIVVNLHCTATGWIKYATTIFAGATNDKTIVRSDDLVSKMKTDPLFLERRWPTSAKDPSGSMHELEGCMTLCDSGYHNWVETMSGKKNPTNAIDARFSGK